MKRKCWPSDFVDEDGFAAGSVKVVGSAPSSDSTRDIVLQWAFNTKYAWPCAGTLASGIPDTISDKATLGEVAWSEFKLQCREAYKSKIIDPSKTLVDWTANILSVAHLVFEEENMLAHTLDFIWSNLVDDAIFSEGKRRLHVLDNCAINGAYLGCTLLKHMYFYDRFHTTFGRRNYKNMRFGEVSSWETLSFAATSSSNEAQSGGGGSISKKN